MKGFSFYLISFCFLLAASDSRAQRQFWGLTAFGGDHNTGLIFKMDADGTNFSVEKSLPTDPESPGQNPGGSLLLASNGKLYGATNAGGLYNAGVFFEYDPTTKVFVKKIDFNPLTIGADPTGRPLQGTNGKIYLTTRSGGGYKTGTLVEYNPDDGTMIKKLDFQLSSIGGYPTGGLTQATNGKIYGMTSNGGSNSLGTIFEYDLLVGAGVQKFSFDNSTGTPFGSTLIEGVSGKLYGVTPYGGISNDGTFFEFNPIDANFTKIADFNFYSIGRNPGGGLVRAGSGKIYGITETGRFITTPSFKDGGILFEFDPSTRIVLAKGVLEYDTFGFVSRGLEVTTSGKFVGITYFGGPNNHGTIFEFDPISFTPQKKFDLDLALSGGNSTSLLTQGSNGMLYGLTQDGGTHNTGTLFEFDYTTQTVSICKNFAPPPEGAYPMGRLSLASNGRLYGLTSAGGATNGGVLFEYNPSNKSIIKKFDFTEAINGIGQTATLTSASDGTLYGVTTSGGTYGKGVLFQFNPLTGVYQKKIDFNDQIGYPRGSLIETQNGSIYGVAEKMIFEFEPVSSTVMKKIDFPFGINGTPTTDLLLASNGKIYGTTYYGGSNDFGVLFEYDLLTNSLSNKYNFIGERVEMNLIEGKDGNLYGLARVDQLATYSIFQFNITSQTYVKLSDLPQGSYPGSSMISNSNGLIYIMLTESGCGSIYEFNPVSKVFNKKPTFAGANCAIPYGNGFLIIKNDQSITFNSLSAKAFGDAPFSLSAVASSGLPITYSSSDPTIASISGNTISILKAGSVVITATQAGDAFTNPASNAQQTLIINKAAQSITFSVLPQKTLGDAVFSLTASANSGLTVTYTSSSDKISLSGNQVTLIKAGRASVTASQGGNGNYAAATPVDQSFCILPAKAVVSISTTNPASPVLTSSNPVGNQWFLNGTAIAGATNASLQVTQSGSYKVQSKVDDCISEFSVDQAVVITGDIPTNNPIALFPNPANDKITIAFKDVPGKKEISILQLNGKKITSLQSEGQETTIVVSNYTPGIYIVQVAAEKTITVLRFTKL